MGQIKHTHNMWCKRKIKRPWSRTSFFALLFGAIAPSPWLETALHIVDDADNANGEHFCTHKWVNVSSNTWQECIKLVHTCMRFLAFITRTIAASISYFLSSSTLTRVSFLSGSDSPLAETETRQSQHEINGIFILLWERVPHSHSG